MKDFTEDETLKIQIANISTKKLLRMETQANIKGCELNNPLMFKESELNENVTIFFGLIIMLFYGIIIGLAIGDVI